ADHLPATAIPHRSPTSPAVRQGYQNHVQVRVSELGEEGRGALARPNVDVSSRRIVCVVNKWQQECAIPAGLVHIDVFRGARRMHEAILAPGRRQVALSRECGFPARKWRYPIVWIRPSLCLSSMLVLGGAACHGY